jgi:hypothetical protein
MILESNCQTKSGTSRLSPTQLFSERLPSSNWLDYLQEGIGWLGFAPGVGAVPDLVNAGIYTLRGNYKEAAISGFFAIPLVGDAAGQVTKRADDIVKAFPKASSQRLAKNLEEAGIPKPTGMKNPQAHHDLPKKFQKDFNAVGLDIDAAQYGRWVEGAEKGVKNKGKHQNWSKEFNDKWDEFLHPENGTSHTKEEMLEFMEEIRKKYPPPTIQ